MRIDDIKGLGKKQEEITLEDLAGHPTIYKLGSNRDWRLRRGVCTKLGDIEVGLWRTLVEGAIAAAGEENVQTILRHWAEDFAVAGGYWFPSDYALAVHCGRTYLDPEWIGYNCYADVCALVNEYIRCGTSLTVSGQWKWDSNQVEQFIPLEKQWNRRREVMKELFHRKEVMTTYVAIIKEGGIAINCSFHANFCPNYRCAD